MASKCADMASIVVQLLLFTYQESNSASNFIVINLKSFYCSTLSINAKVSVVDFESMQVTVPNTKAFDKPPRGGHKLLCHYFQTSDIVYEQATLCSPII
jgi:hypothetical protein